MTGLRRLGAWLWRSPYLLLSVAAFFWASNSVVGRAARDTIPPAALSFWRWFVAAALMVALAWPRFAAQRAEIRAYWRQQVDREASRSNGSDSSES